MVGVKITIVVSNYQSICQANTKHGEKSTRHTVNQLNLAALKFSYLVDFG